jgi:hypothetical protein
MASVNPIQIEKYLKGVDFPAKKADLIKRAAQNGADGNVRSMLQQLPDQQFYTSNDVSKAISALGRGR